MVVAITNVTDGPGKSPTQVDVYNKTLDPGASLKLPADLIDERIRNLERQGLIAIGKLPAWYVAGKTRRGRALTTEEKQNRVASPPAPVSQAPIISAEKRVTLDIVDQMETVDDISLEQRRRRK